MLKYCIPLLALLVPAAVLAQPNKLLLSFNGQYHATNAAGQVIYHRVTERAWAAEHAAATGVNPANLAVVYSINGSAMGDTIDIVDKQTGQVLASPVGFFFGQDFGRQRLLSADGLRERRLDYIYTRQNSHSLGSALVDVRRFVSKGQTNRVTFSGHMQWLVTAEGTNSLRVCSGRFITRKPFVPAAR